MAIQPWKAELLKFGVAAVGQLTVAEGQEGQGGTQDAHCADLQRLNENNCWEIEETGTDGRGNGASSAGTEQRRHSRTPQRCPIRHVVIQNMIDTLLYRVDTMDKKNRTTERITYPSWTAYG